jgi:hypothetical protein
MMEIPHGSRRMVVHLQSPWRRVEREVLLEGFERVVTFHVIAAARHVFSMHVHLLMIPH